MIFSVFFQVFSSRLGFLQSTNKSTEEYKVNQTSATTWGENKFLCPAPCDDSHNWHSKGTATHQPLHWGFLKYVYASDNHLETSWATRKSIKDSSSPACYMSIKLIASSASSKTRALEPAVGNAVWAMKGLHKSRHHLQQLLFFQPKNSCYFSGAE